MTYENHALMRRELGLGGAVVTGLGSILGTGVFVSIAVAAGFAGRGILIAVPAAALVAIWNGLSSAQLASAHPVSGGTYEYGYRFLSPWFGYSAGWLFLIAKTASAATAALGLAAYILGEATIWFALITVGAVTLLILSGIRRTATANLVLVGVTVAALVAFMAVGAFPPPGAAPIEWTAGPAIILEAIAFLLVAYTGYGRIATLGEEVKDPSRIIPKAIIICLATTAFLYAGVAWALLAVGGGNSGSTDVGFLAGLTPAPLDILVRVGAALAMIGVIVNLVLGLSRVWLAMGRRGDMPGGLAHLSSSDSPNRAVVLTGITVAGVALVGDLRLTWEFSAFAVLLYYAITNLAALRLPERRFPVVIPLLGLSSCIFLSFWVTPGVWVTGVGILILGLGWKAVSDRFSARARSR